MLSAKGGSCLRQLIRIVNKIQKSSPAFASAGHTATCQCQTCSGYGSSVLRSNFATAAEPPAAASPGTEAPTESQVKDLVVAGDLKSLREEADEALSGIVRIRPPTRDSAGSAELPMASAKPPAMPTADTIIRRMLGERGIAIARHLEAEAPPGQIGTAFSAALKDIRVQGLSIDEAWDEQLEAWESMLDEGLYDKVLQEMEEKGGTDNELLTTLYRDIAKRQDNDRRAERRAQVMEMRAQIAASRVRMVDELGRAYATGKRKTSIARVWIKLTEPARAFISNIYINGRHFDDYIKPWMYRDQIMEPFVITNTLGLFDVRVNVHGGGAIRHGISKALQCFEPELRPFLKQAGLLTRDSRVVERKKPGKAKARKSYQWVKR